MVDEIQRPHALTIDAGPLHGGAEGKRERRRYTVFLIEDEPSDRDGVLQTLNRSPLVARAHWFRTGERLMRYLAYGVLRRTLLDCAPAMVLVDLQTAARETANIAGQDDMSFLHQLKHNPLTSYMPVVLFTGGDPNEKKAHAFRLGANAFVSKPVELDRLHDVMLTGWSWPPLWAPPPLA